MVWELIGSEYHWAMLVVDKTIYDSEKSINHSKRDWKMIESGLKEASSEEDSEVDLAYILLYWESYSFKRR